MHIIKYIAIALWSLILMAMVLAVLRLHPFIRRKKEKDINVSEGIYATALLISAALIMLQVVPNLGLAFDVLQKLSPQKFWISFLETGSVMAVSALLIFLLTVVVARWLSVLVAGNRHPLIELDADHRGYALFRAGLLLGLTILVAGFSGAVFQLMVPEIELPFYR